MIKKKRIAFLDTARSLSMIWVIAVIHMSAYVRQQQIVPHEYLRCISICALSLFTFISGYFLSGKTESLSDIGKFYCKRLKRFFPLFLLSAVSLYILHLTVRKFSHVTSVDQLIYTVTGTACFINKAPATLWYISMLMFFYLLTPFINIAHRPAVKIIICVVTEGILLTGVFLGISDERPALYFPLYALALIISGKIKLREGFSIWVFLVGTVVSVGAVLIDVRAANLATDIIVALVLPVPVLELSKLLSYKKAGVLFGYISYASMCAYLFHRQFFGLILAKFGKVDILIFECILFPAFLVMCYFIQKLYDRIVFTVTRSKKRNG